jgi:hypothetical protein
VNADRAALGTVAREMKTLDPHSARGVNLLLTRGLMLRWVHWGLLLLAWLPADGFRASDLTVTPAARGSILAWGAERGANLPAVAPAYRSTLKAEHIWQLNLPGGERFDASALAFTAAGDLLTLSDRGPAIYKIQFLPNTNAADLVQVPTCFTPAQLQPFAREKTDRYDSEGMAIDQEGRIYICEEADRWILRCDPGRGTVERLPIDWAPVRKYFDSFDRNASFEGIAIGQGRLYVANERQLGRIIVVDLASLHILGDFAPRPSTSNARDIHYSDLSWWDGVLYALLRESRCVLAVDPADHHVLAEYDFKEMERDPEVIYRSIYPTGQMEGLAVTADYLWLVTDNNGCGRVKYPQDIRPTLFKCRRPPLVRSR